MTKIRLGTTELNMTYTDDELCTMILRYVKSQNDGVGFRDICTYVMTEAQEEGRIDGSRDEAYQWEELNREDLVRVDKAIWRLIWHHSLMIDFDATHYPTQDIYFLSV